MNNLFCQCDLHVHTYFSPCGWDEMVPDAILETAKSRGIKYLGISDHLHANTDIDRLLSLRAEFNNTNGINFFFGCEADIDAVGDTPITPEIASRLDYVLLGPTHFMHGFGKQLSTNDPDVVAGYMLELFAYSVRLDFADVVAHPFMVAPNGRYSTLSQDLLTNDRLTPSLELAKENNIAMEISRRAFLPGQEEFYLRFYKLCKKIGLKFSIGNDAHKLADLGRTDLLEPIIREVDITERDIWLPGVLQQ